MSGPTPEDPLSQEIRGLQRPLPGRRLVSWLLFLVALTAFLLLPVGAALFNDDQGGMRDWPLIGAMFGDADRVDAQLLGRRPDPSVKPDFIPRDAQGVFALADLTGYQATPPTLMALDRWWNPGPLAAAHQPWANDCRACHAAPFGRVRDEDCLACHKVLGDHVDFTQVKDARLEVRCASCHRDHKGEFALAAQNKHAVGRDCADCHRDIKASYADTQTENVRDFVDEHPQFRVQVASDAAGKVLQRVRLPTNGLLSQPTNLKFPHDVHMSDKGVGSPNGKVVMKCADCHEANGDGIGFRPTTMQDHCQSCHALKMEPTLSNREVPHGPVDDVLSTLREFYSFVATTGSVPRGPEPLTRNIVIKRPGEPERAPRSFVSMPGDGKARATAAAIEMFEKTSCVICHEVKRVPGPGKAGTPGRDLPQWEIAAVAPDHAWMPKSTFTHASHSAATCESCHAASKSKEATEVLMPGIDGCRDCHAGTKPVADKIVSDCALCHGFHMPGHTPPQPPAKGYQLLSGRAQR